MIHQLLINLGACEEAREFAEKYATLADAWDACDSSEWMMWYLCRIYDNSDAQKRQHIELICRAAERVLPLFEQQHPSDSRLRQAIVIARSGDREAAVEATPGVESAYTSACTEAAREAGITAACALWVTSRCVDAAISPSLPCLVLTTRYIWRPPQARGSTMMGQVTAFSYDPSGYLTNIASSSNTLSLAYDSAGRVRSVTDVDGYTVTAGYDALDRVTNVAFPDGTSIQKVYDKLDAIAIKGRDNRWTYQTFDPLRHLTDVQDPSGNITHANWCSCGSLESITDSKGQLTLWNRYGQSRISGKLYPDLSKSTYAYEATTSRLQQVLDAAGKTTALAYNADDTLKQITFSGGASTPGVTNAYDASYDRMTAMVDGIGTTTLGYVPAGQPGAGNLQSVTNPLPNSVITYGYDPLGRVQSVQIGGTGASVLRDDLCRIYWSSNALGATTIRYVGATERPALISSPNGFGTTFGYTPVASGSLLQSMTTTNANGQVIEQYGYSYDLRNLMLWQTNTIGGVTSTWSYAYDLAQQLTAATQLTNGVVAHRYAYAYDRAGNRVSEQIDATSATETPNVDNQVTSRTGGGVVRVTGYLSETGTVTIAGAPARMTSPTNFEGEAMVGVGSYSIPVTATDLSNNSSASNVVRTFTANGLDTTFTYDLAGNQLTKSNSTGVLALGWDGADRCTAITNGVYRTAIAYDGISRWSRITEYSNATLTADRRFIWNGATLAEERDASGSNVVQRFFANGFQRAGTNYFYVRDHLGSIREVYDASGALQARFEYDPYGRRTQVYGTLWVDFGFAGLFEPRNGLKLAVWRIYQPDVAKWGNRDPIRERGGFNLYRYCANNPISLSDPSGLTEGFGSDHNYFEDFFFPEPGNFYAKAENLKPEPGINVITGHGPKALGQLRMAGNMDPFQLAAVILSDTLWGYRNFSSIKVASCFASRAETTTINGTTIVWNKAAWLAYLTKMPVIATPNEVDYPGFNIPVVTGLLYYNSARPREGDWHTIPVPTGQDADKYKLLTDWYLSTYPKPEGFPHP